MAQSDYLRQTAVTLEENLKKALTELLILRVLSEREYYIGELTETLHKKSGETLTIVFPYSAIYRLIHAGYIIESQKRVAPDGRRRQYFDITPSGREYLALLLRNYERFNNGIANILAPWND